MKKSILSCAVVAILAAGSANAAEIYNDDDYSINIGGRIHSQIDRFDDKTMSSGYTRLNIAGKAKLNDSMYAIAFAEKELNFNGDDWSRDMYAGLGTSYGEFLMGYYGSALEQITDFTDVLMTAGAKASTKIDEDRDSGAMIYRLKTDDFSVVGKYKAQDYDYDNRKDEKDESYSASVVYSGFDNFKFGVGYANTHYEEQVEAAISYTYNALILSALVNHSELDISGFNLESDGFEFVGSYTFDKIMLSYAYNKLETDKFSISSDGSIPEDPDIDEHVIEASYLFNANLRVFGGVLVDNVESRDETHLNAGIRFYF